MGEKKMTYDEAVTLLRELDAAVAAGGGNVPKGSRVHEAVHVLASLSIPRGHRGEPPESTGTPLRTVPAEVAVALTTGRTLFLRQFATAVECGGRKLEPEEAAGLVRMLGDFIEQKMVDQRRLNALSHALTQVDDMAKGLDKVATTMRDTVRRIHAEDPATAEESQGG